MEEKKKTKGTFSNKYYKCGLYFFTFILFTVDISNFTFRGMSQTWTANEIIEHEEHDCGDMNYWVSAHLIFTQFAIR